MGNAFIVINSRTLGKPGVVLPIGAEQRPCCRQESRFLPPVEMTGNVGTKTSNDKA